MPIAAPSTKPVRMCMTISPVWFFQKFEEVWDLSSKEVYSRIGQLGPQDRFGVLPSS
jgi:hypothetical protein